MRILTKLVKQNSKNRLLLVLVTGSIFFCLSLILASPCWCAPEDDTLKLRQPIGGGDAGENIEERKLADEINVFDPKAIKLKRPELNGLVTIDKSLNPFNLDAQTPKPVSLKDVLYTAIERNLDIGIADTEKTASKWDYRKALSGFLPSASLAYNYNYLNGALNLPIASPEGIRFNNPFILTSAGINYGLYRGGRTVFGALQARNNYRASGHKKDATVNDVLTGAYEKYYKLILSESVLRIRIQAVKVSEENLKITGARFDAGSATRLDVMQARTQLSSDRQKLIDQQIDRRQSAIELAEFLNVEQDLDLLPEDLELKKKELVSQKSRVQGLLVKALSTRPELKLKEELRLAARKEIVKKAAPLQPDVNFSTSVFGIGETLSNSKKTVTVQGVSGPVSRSVSRQIKPLLVVGLGVNWKFDGMGMKDISSIQKSRYEARKANLNLTKEVNQVVRQVRGSYLNVLRADRQIDEALIRLHSSKEEINLARLRYENGLGKNIDVLRAQSDYTSALIRKATALVNYNIAQGQLVRDLGVTSVASLTSDLSIKL